MEENKWQADSLQLFVTMPSSLMGKCYCYVIVFVIVLIPKWYIYIHMKFAIKTSDIIFTNYILIVAIDTQFLCLYWPKWLLPYSTYQLHSWYICVWVTYDAGLIPGLCPANERRRYFVKLASWKLPVSVYVADARWCCPILFVPFLALSKTVVYYYCYCYCCRHRNRHYCYCHCYCYFHAWKVEH